MAGLNSHFKKNINVNWNAEVQYGWVMTSQVASIFATDKKTTWKLWSDWIHISKNTNVNWNADVQYGWVMTPQVASTFATDKETHWKLWLGWIHISNKTHHKLKCRSWIGAMFWQTCCVCLSPVWGLNAGVNWTALGLWVGQVATAKWSTTFLSHWITRSVAPRTHSRFCLWENHVCHSCEGWLSLFGRRRDLRCILTLSWPLAPRWYLMLRLFLLHTHNGRLLIWYDVWGWHFHVVRCLGLTFLN